MESFFAHKTNEKIEYFRTRRAEIPFQTFTFYCSRESSFQFSSSSFSKLIWGAEFSFSSCAVRFLRYTKIKSEQNPFQQQHANMSESSGGEVSLENKQPHSQTLNNILPVLLLKFLSWALKFLFIKLGYPRPLPLSCSLCFWVELPFKKLWNVSKSFFLDWKKVNYGEQTSPARNETLVLGHINSLRGWRQHKFMLFILNSHDAHSLKNILQKYKILSRIPNFSPSCENLFPYVPMSKPLHCRPKKELNWHRCNKILISHNPYVLCIVVKRRCEAM